MFSKFQKNTEYIHIIPLFEGVDTQIRAKKFFCITLNCTRKLWHSPFICASLSRAATNDFLPIPTVLANKIILSDLRELGRKRAFLFLHHRRGIIAV